MNEEALNTHTALVRATLVKRRPSKFTRHPFAVRLGVIEGGLETGCQTADVVDAKTWPSARKKAREALAELLSRGAKPLAARANDLLTRSSELEAAAVRVRNEAAALVSPKRARKASAP